MLKTYNLYDNIQKISDNSELSENKLKAISIDSKLYAFEHLMSIFAIYIIDETALNERWSLCLLKLKTIEE